jgi:inhibitor-of-growth protein 1
LLICYYYTFKGEPEREGNRETSKKSVTTEREIKRARRARHEVFVPSIHGPSSLAVTSYVDGEGAGTSSSKNTSVVYTNFGGSTEKASGSVGGSASNNAGESAQKNGSEDTPSRGSGRGGERGGGGTSGGGGASARVAAVAAASADRTEDVVHPRTEKSAGTAGASSSAPTPKKQSQKSQAQEKKPKKRKGKQTKEASDPDPVDPDEPTYCLCDQVGLLHFC